MTGTACQHCDAASIRTRGEYVTMLERLADKRLYCTECAVAWERGDFDGDPDHDSAAKDDVG